MTTSSHHQYCRNKNLSIKPVHVRDDSISLIFRMAYAGASNLELDDVCRHEACRLVDKWKTSGVTRLHLISSPACRMKIIGILHAHQQKVAFSVTRWRRGIIPQSKTKYVWGSWRGADRCVASEIAAGMARYPQYLLQSTRYLNNGGIALRHRRHI